MSRLLSWAIIIVAAFFFLASRGPETTPAPAPAASGGWIAADEIGPRMSCRAVRRVMDAKGNDSQVAEIARVAKQIYVQLDRANAGAGGAMVFDRMNGDGRRDMIIHALSRCGDHPDDTLERSAASVHAGMRAIGRELLGDK